jgi:hypothetical protein
MPAGWRAMQEASRSPHKARALTRVTARKLGLSTSGMFKCRDFLTVNGEFSNRKADPCQRKR